MERVLIVDDDPDIQRLVSYNLIQAGFRTSSATTGVPRSMPLKQAPGSDHSRYHAARPRWTRGMPDTATA